MNHNIVYLSVKFSAGAATFEYDAKGRQVMSAYGSVLSTVYNLLDLPQRHTTGEGTVVDYKYAFDGRKLQEKATAGASVILRDYSGEFLYEGGVLKKILFDGGYVINGESGPVYMFFLKDHLGSVRAVVSETGVVQQINHYYPYGDLFPNTSNDSSGNRYKYTGKEAGDETDLFDCSARFLHTRFGRFTTIDPLAEKYPGISPYAYCNGNPVNFVDPDGKYFEGVNDKRALRMQRKLERRAEKLSKQAERLKRRNKDAEDLIERAMELRKSAQDIRDMRGDVDTEYRFIRSKTPETYAKMESKTEVVYMHFQDFETKIHEARHGGQHARGEINALNFQGYGVMDEVDSYRAQYSWRGVYHYFYDDTSEWAVMNRIYRGLNPLVGTINNIRDITHAFDNHLYEDGT